MIEYDDNGYIHVINWGKYQNVEALEKVKEKNRLRQAKHREKIKLLSQKTDVTEDEKKPDKNNGNSNVMSRCDSNVTVTLCHALDRDRDKDKDNKRKIEKKESPKRPRFVPPTKEEVEQYAKKMGYTSFDADLFISYYEACGWYVKNHVMKSWEAAVRTWAARDKRQYFRKPTAAAGPHVQSNFDQRQDDLDAMLKNGRIDRGYG